MKENVVGLLKGAVCVFHCKLTYLTNWKTWRLSISVNHELISWINVVLDNCFTSELHGVDLPLVPESTIPEFHHHPIWPSRIPGISWLCLRNSFFSRHGAGHSNWIVLVWNQDAAHFPLCLGLKRPFQEQLLFIRHQLMKLAPSLQESWEKQTDPGSLVCNKKARPRAVSQEPSGSYSKGSLPFSSTSLRFKALETILAEQPVVFCTSLFSTSPRWPRP